MTEIAQSTLTDFLLARIAEDETVANGAGGARWRQGRLETVNPGPLSMDEVYAGRSVTSFGWSGAETYPQPVTIEGSHVCLAPGADGKIPPNRSGGQVCSVHPFDTSVTPHIARHDPARVLAECEAKRRIVGLWNETHGPYDDDSTRCPCDPATGPRDLYEVHDGHAGALSDVMRLLALPYADHPDYRNEWRP